MKLTQRIRGVAVDGAAIREHRMHVLHLHGVELAERAGISPQYLCMIESGKRTHVGPGVYGRLIAALELAEQK
jgi:transcriptional regulator with XRE-family HTH domain